MGLETEKVDTRIFMDDDNFPRSGGPVLSEAEKCAEDELDRDPHGMNAHLQLGFEDVIAEPELTHSFDRVWICSHALFELSKYVIYKLLTLVLAIPLALVVGIIFAALSCLHIWIVVPFVKTCLMVLPSVQTVWKSLTDVFAVPFFQSLGRCFAMVNIRLDQE
ncbi:caveolin-2 [Chiroxiphia lanceolata]|uniref:Caveolin n=2 Tax=Pipridae TaxID=114313 RepID=A0A6J0HH69_9PASS|nr:PREDICTED: caveolin-2 [Lepidothrix coronata]XP_027520818.1 caveolin-2 [Corapipo altera]XP_027586871.2 caveolin-2 [Pipra filicauda]XP_032544582.1 caveolin-2 [Chiroxiphia lanceolata]XP_051651563.1 caveolin-2 [Manacus candei]